MRRLLILLAACSAAPKTTVPAPPAGAIEESNPIPKPEPPPEPPVARGETMTGDTPKTTVAGNAFIAPAGWTVVVKGAATIVTAPETDSRVALVDVEAASPDEAVSLAWAALGDAKKHKLRVATKAADRDGWSQQQNYSYETSPNEKRIVQAAARFANGMWTVILADVSDSVAEKRGAQVGTLLGKLLPKGYSRESFAGKKANPLDKARIAELSKFIETAQRLTTVPGVALGIVENGKVVFAGGFGVRELGKPAKVDADTKFIIGSSTKSLTTLMLAKLVDEKKLTWETAATSLLPQFKLGDADTTTKVLVKHLICACTGLPRQDMEWIFEFGKLTPETALATLATMQPTSKFGELFQYSNPLAAAAGFIGGHVAFPKLELGKAYDEAMRTRVFEPLGMKATTFDFKRGQQGNVAAPHAMNLENKQVAATSEVNRAVIPVRPAGGAWSSVRDVLKYVQMELAEGKLPSGKQYVGKEALLARRNPQVAIGQDYSYGMGLMIDRRYGVTIVAHGGDIIGFHGDMMWFPEYGVGAVILTNGEPGSMIRTVFRRKLLEVMFDGKPEADATLVAQTKAYFDGRNAARAGLAVPAKPEEAAKLAPHYVNEALGEIKVGKAGAATVFDFGEWKSEMASKQNPDGSVSFSTLAPGVDGIELVAGTANGKRSLTLRDAQHEYVFLEK